MCVLRVRVYVCARAIGFSWRRSKRSYLTRHFRIGGIATVVYIVAVYLCRDHTHEIGTSRVARECPCGPSSGSDNRLPL